MGATPGILTSAECSPQSVMFLGRPLRLLPNKALRVLPNELSRSCVRIILDKYTSLRHCTRSSWFLPVLLSINDEILQVPFVVCDSHRQLANVAPREKPSTGLHPQPTSHVILLQKTIMVSCSSTEERWILTFDSLTRYHATGIARAVHSPTSYRRSPASYIIIILQVVLLALSLRVTAD